VRVYYESNFKSILVDRTTTVAEALAAAAQKFKTDTLDLFYLKEQRNGQGAPGGHRLSLCVCVCGMAMMCACACGCVCVSEVTMCVHVGVCRAPVSVLTYRSLLLRGHGAPADVTLEPTALLHTLVQKTKDGSEPGPNAQRFILARRNSNDDDDDGGVGGEGAGRTLLRIYSHALDMDVAYRTVAITPTLTAAEVRLCYCL
jgi:hypothetical protein